jgi:hypothetical protein
MHDEKQQWTQAKSKAQKIKKKKKKWNQSINKQWKH